MENMSLTQLILALLGALTAGGFLTGIVLWFLNKRNFIAEVRGKENKNVKDASDLTEVLRETAEKAVKREFEKNEQLNTLKTQVEVEKGMRKSQGETLMQVVKDLGATAESEKNCQSQMREIKAEIAEIKFKSEQRSEERHNEMMAMFKQLFEKCTISPRQD